MAAATIAMSGLAPLATRVQVPRRTARATVACKVGLRHALGSAPFFHALRARPQGWCLSCPIFLDGT
eukprot:6270660-Pyramimonas_sp.AAC.1